MVSRDFELAMAKKVNGSPVIVGVDEAGRGPLAGPVVAAACYIPIGIKIDGVDDSKKLTEKEREALFEILTTHKKVRYAISFVDRKKIEEINILHAAMLAMDQAVESLGVNPDLVLIDGPRLPPRIKERENATAVVKGDSKSFSIAAASIIAKVSRDRHMLEMHKKWPEYHFSSHKGYGTAAHVAAIRQHGPCPIHRMTFNPVKTWFGQKTEKKEKSSTDSRAKNTTSKKRNRATKKGKQKSKNGKRRAKRTARSPATTMRVGLRRSSRIAAQ